MILDDESQGSEGRELFRSGAVLLCFLVATSDGVNFHGSPEPLTVNASVLS